MGNDLVSGSDFDDDEMSIIPEVESDLRESALLMNNLKFLMHIN